MKSFCSLGVDHTELDMAALNVGSAGKKIIFLF
jgi:hypothetical protein